MDKRNSNFLVRDGRRKEMFRLDDEYLNGYARLCGAKATLVYLCLCRHADRHQESYPSVELMSEKLGISRDGVMRGIKSLVEWGIISKDRTRRENATWLNNTYTLLDKSVWKKKPSQVANNDMEEESSQVAKQGVAKSQNRPSQVAHSDTKVAHKKDTHKEGTAAEPAAGDSLLIIEVLDAFKKWNSAAAKWYANKTQRDACSRLLKAHGLEKLLKVIAILPKTNQTPYIPTITTPNQLEDKWSALESSLQRKKAELELKKPTVVI